MLKNCEHIGAHAFEGCSSLEISDIGKQVKDVGDYAFANCTSIKTMHIGIKIFGSHVFENCTSLKEVIIGDSASVGDYGFAKCTALESVTVSESVTVIKEGTFMDCTSLKTVDIKGAVSIYKSAFQGCTSLESIDLEKVDSIGDHAFKDCVKLESVKSNGVMIYSHAFENCTSLRSVVFGDGVRIVYDNAFKNCTSLESVVFGNEVTVVHGDAFNNCASLKSIAICGKTEIRNNAFDNCVSLDTLIVHGSAIDVPLFDNRSMFKRVIFEESVESIGAHAFENWTSLESVEIRGKVTIGENAFCNCNLTMVVFKDSVKSVEKGAFINTNNPDLLKKIDVGNGMTLAADFKAVFGHDAYTESGVISKDYSNSVFELQNDRFIQHPKAKVTVDENVAVVIDGTTYTDTSFFVEKGTIVKVLVNYKDGYESTLTINNDEVEEGEYTISGDTDISAWYEPVLNGGSTDDDHVIIAFVEGIIVKCGDRILQNGETVEYGTELTVSVAEGYDYNVIKAGDIRVNGKWIAEGNTIFIGVVEDDSGIDPEFTAAVELIAFILVVTAGALILARYR